jgi:hypothetical protein
VAAPPADSLYQEVGAILRRAGWHVGAIWRLYPPRVPGEPAEVLFTGHPAKAKQADAPYTAILPDVTSPRPEIRPGW